MYISQVVVWDLLNQQQYVEIYFQM